MRNLHWMLSCVLALGCSLANREGLELSCDELQDGAINACQQGIITSCSAGRVSYAVCDGKDACEQSWQEDGAFRCVQSDSLPEPGIPSSGGASGGSGGSGSAVGGSNGGGGSSDGGSSPDGGSGGDSSGGASSGAGGGSSNDCTDEPCPLATTTNDIDVLVADSNNIYFGACDTVYSVSKSGGPSTVLLSFDGGCNLGEIAAGGGQVFAEYNDIVFRTPVSGGATTEEVSGENFVGNIAADDQFLYWVGGNARSGVNQQTLGGEPVLIPDSDAFADGLQVTDGYVYWSVNAGIERVPTDGSGLQLFNISGTAEFKATGEFLFVLSGTKLTSISLSSGTEIDLAMVSNAGQVTADATHVYWTETNGVKTVPVGGGAVDVFDESPVEVRTNVGGIEVDDDFVYWTDGPNVWKKAAL